jgi:uncharacterized membrane protein YqjE
VAAVAADNRPENIATTLGEVADRTTVIVREEIELAKAEMTTKVASLARGAAAVAVGAVLGVFALIYVFLTIAWGINEVTSHLWLGFAVVMVLLVALTLGSFFFAWRKLRVGAPTPKLAIDEAKKITATVKSGTDA